MVSVIIQEIMQLTIIIPTKEIAKRTMTKKTTKMKAMMSRKRRTTMMRRRNIKGREKREKIRKCNNWKCDIYLE